MQFDHVVDAQNSDGRLRGELQALDFGDGRFEDARLFAVPHDPFVEIKTNPENRKFTYTYFKGHLIDICIYDTFDNLQIKNEFLKYLKESCW